MNQVVPSLVEASYVANPGFLTFRADALVNFGTTIADKKDGYPVISNYWQSQEPRPVDTLAGFLFICEINNIAR